MDNLFEKYRDEFNDYLDQNGDIEIGTFSMPPSVILETMDEEAYKEQLLDFIQEKKVSHQDTVYTYFPAPIAYFYERTINSSENEHHQFQLLRSTWESVIYILFATVIGEVHKKRFDLSSVRLFNGQSIKNDYRGTLCDKLGWKMEFIQKVLEYDRENSNALKCTDFIEDQSIELLKELNHERNSYSHTAALSASEVNDRFNQILPKVEDLLFDLDFLENVSILRFKKNINRINNIRFNKFDGHSLREVNYEKEFALAELSTLGDILDSENMLMEFDGDIFCVSPFIHFIMEGTSQKIVICYYKKINRTSGLWIYEPIAGSETEIELDSASFKYNINDSLLIS